MKRGNFTRLLYALLILVSLNVAAGFSVNPTLLSQREPQAQADSVIKPRYSVRKTSPLTEEDLKEKASDLRTPDNIKEEVEYDENSDTYTVGNKMGESYLTAPLLMNTEEYQEWSLQRSLRAFYRQKNRDSFEEQGKDKFDFTDMKFDLGPAEKIFGPGGIQIKTQGSAEIKLGANMRNIDNPSLPINNRKTFGFDFNEKINLSVNGKVGDKVNMNLNYNTQATFDFDTQNLKLKYEGKEDEIIKLVEAGNVSMPSNSSLITGASQLFGFRTDLQFGKLKLQAVASQKKTSSQTVSSKGGAQTTSFEFSAVNYEENRHFFLAHYFRDRYDQNMANLPNITSGITINRVEVWITNKRGYSENQRNIVGFTDLGEYRRISNPIWNPSGSELPNNRANDLYTIITTSFSAARNIDLVNTTLDGISGFAGGTDYEKLQSARKLSSSEYSINSALGYISLRSSLQTDEVLAVAFEYTYGGVTYQVGEFANDITDSNSALFVKTLKNTANVPAMGNWDLMMKNVYSLGATSIQKEKFRLDIKFQSDTAGVYLTYLPEENLKSKTILRLLNLDKLDANNRTNPDGRYDFVEGYTIQAQYGQVIFPVVEPFGDRLRSAIGNDAIANKYCYDALYDSTKTIARQIAEQDKFILTGQFKGTDAAVIDLGAMNIPQGSVVVTAGGVTLTEGSDYQVDYSKGEVTIINQSILDAGTNVSVSLESNTDFSMVRKTLIGTNFMYDVSKDFSFGGTLMHLSERAQVNKVNMGSEPLNNTVWGLNMAWRRESQWLTNVLAKLPGLHCTAPSSINFSGEFAQLIAGENSGTQDNASYIDDFERTKAGIDMRTPSAWMISSTPSDFSESLLSNDVRYGYNRALLSWYYIDPLFTRRSSSLTPSHIKSDLNQLSNHYVREVYERELYPKKSQTTTSSSTMSILNLAYYPTERGPYNLDPNLTPEGLLTNPTQRWGGMMRKLDQNDFQRANIEYVEFWMLDPFIYDDTSGQSRGGDFYINLGEISEDILKDGKKYYESGMPIDGSSSGYSTTTWGRVPNGASVTYAFNTSSGARNRQDVGLNGLSSTEEATFDSYQNYLNTIQGVVSPTVFDSIARDPAGDDYHYFRGTDFDREQRSILDRYKRINMPEGNSVDSDNSPERYDTSYKTSPDVEDLNQDYTLNEYEKYFQYHISMRPEDMRVGSNYIVDRRLASVRLRNGNTEEVTWYQFRIPLTEYQKRVGGITDFTSIRFMRMFMANFEQPIVLRFATLDLIQGEWRTYEQALYTDEAPATTGTLSISGINLEENGDKLPVNYVLPPGIRRTVDPSQSQLVESNEQALAINVTDLAVGDARAVYKNMNYDMRRYKHMQMFIHANALLNNMTDLEDNQMSVFIRLGSDYRSNYYEYEIPLKLTPEGSYANGSPVVWPSDNMLDIDLDIFTNLKKSRNTARSMGTASYNRLYYLYDEDKPNNKVSIMGNPTLGEVKTIMIGVRNNSRATKSVEVWVNELRLQEYTNEGGWAAQGRLNVQLSDVGAVNMTGRAETAGFGGIEQNVADRSDENSYQYGVTTNFELGKFFPDKAKVQAPIYYSYTKEKVSPKYNPLDTDMLLDEALEALTTEQEKDSLRSLTTTTVVNRNFSLSGVKVNIVSKNAPMPYDPGNFTFSYSNSHRRNEGETTAWETDKTWRGSLNYRYAPSYKPFEPFKKSIKSKSKWLTLVKELNFNYLPQEITFNTDMVRNYYELQERDLDNLDNPTALPMVFSQQFLWNRDFSLKWDLMKSLKLSFRSATKAEVEEPYTPVNKDLYPDRYSQWKDSVWHSIKGWGTPLDYTQSFEANYSVPLSKIPALNWVTSSTVGYNSSYSWNRGTELEDGTTLGHTIVSQRRINAAGRLSFDKLYDNVPFLKETNRRFTTSGRNRAATAKKNAATTKAKAAAAAAEGKAEEPEKKEKGFSKEVTLKTDTVQNLIHNLRTKRIRVTALNKEGNRYPIKYKVLDNNKIQLLTLDSVGVKVSVTPLKKPEDKKWYPILQHVARTAMMVRSANISYTNSYSMSLPGFQHMVGDMFGQGSGGSLKPGLDFAFGFIGDSYIDRASANGWLINNDSISSPATTSQAEDLQLKMTLEPLLDLKIDLNASRTTSKSGRILYMYDGMPTTRSGSFNMTTIAIGSAFAGRGNADNGYTSKTFNKFVSFLDTYQQRVEAQYVGSVYPAGSTMAGQAFDPENGTVNKYSADVMVPAFLAAYTGGGTNRALDIFPTLAKLLPNWSVSYSGLGKLPWMSEHFKSFTINHAYKCLYAVGSYNTFTSYMEYMNGLGFVNDVTTGNPIPNSMFDVSTVSINESFSPLMGVNMTFNNNLTTKFEYRTTRVLSLSMTSAQLNETSSQDIVVGFGYKINDLKLFANKGGKSKRGSSKSKRNAAEEDKKTSTTSKKSFNNDLTLSLDFTYRNQAAINRNIQYETSEATSGNRALSTKFMASYSFSRLITMSAYFDRQNNRPLLSTNSYPTITQDFGVSMRFMLTR